MNTIIFIIAGVIVFIAVFIAVVIKLIKKLENSNFAKNLDDQLISMRQEHENEQNKHKKVKCEYCGNFNDAKHNKCQNCGAAINHAKKKPNSFF